MEEVGEAVTYAAGGAAAGGGAALALQGLAGVALPTIMSTTGTVVVGVGTIQSGLTAGVAAFAATGVAGFAAPVAIVGAAVGAGYYMFF
tara:strand:- start:273 stop:539 length:267 start_codon:yes stop_codon:yes gene_type:complete